MAAYDRVFTDSDEQFTSCEGQIVQDCTGENFGDLIRDMKMKKAAELLRDRRMPPEEVAEDGIGGGNAAAQS